MLNKLEKYHSKILLAKKENSKYNIGIDNILEHIINKKKEMSNIIISCKGIPKIANKIIPNISTVDLLLQGSRIAPSGSGNYSMKELPKGIPTNTQKWWASILLGFIFALIASISIKEFTNLLFKEKNKFLEEHSMGTHLERTLSTQTAKEILLKTILFILVIRYLLW